MTKEECAIVTLYTGVAMLEGDDLEYLYRYAEKLMERPVLTHELVTLEEELKKRAEPDFINLCRWAGAEAVPFVQPEVRTEMSSADTISRQAAIDAIFSEPLYKSGMKKRDADEVVPAIYEKIKSLPSAQAEERTEERTETHACDCISRQAAIDALIEWYGCEPCDIGAFENIVEKLPSAQPELCEDAVSREAIMKHYDSGEFLHVNHVSRNNLLDFIEQLPSVTPKAEQPEISCSEIPNSSDTISRQDALNFKATITGVRSGKTAILKLFEAYQDYIKSLPSAQPEKRTYKRTEMYTCDLIDRQPSSSCVHEKDTISRQAALHLITEYNGVMDKSVAKRLLMHLPSAQPKAEERTAESAQNVPNGDLVSRKAAIDEITEYGSGNTIYMSVVELKRRIEHLPPAQSEPQWIPCSERLPEEKDAGILKKLGTNKRSDYVIATVEAKGERMTVTACTYDGAWDWNMKYAFPDYKIIAWMPLPEPYKGGREE